MKSIATDRCLSSDELIARTSAAGRNPYERVVLMGDGTSLVCYRYRAEEWATRDGGEIRPATAEELAKDDVDYASWREGF